MSKAILHFRIDRDVLLFLRIKKKMNRVFCRKYSGLHKVSLIPGHGIGPEISESVKKVFQSAEVPVEWETVSVEPVVGPDGKPTIPAETLASFQRTKVGLKGPLMTPVGKGYMSLNLLLRKTFSLYANVRPCRSIPNLERTPYSNVDTVLIRENTEGEYSGIEHELVPGQLTTSIKVITQKACQRILHFAFRHCLELGRPSVTVVHKAAIMRATDGLFLECARKTALDYPSLFLRELSLDDACFELVREPCQFNNTVMVMPNLYGDILSDLSAGLIGGLGLTPSGNIGDNGALFESVHGTAPDIAGKDLANPTALLMSSIMLLRHLKLFEHAEKIQAALLKTLSQGKYLTQDLGGTTTNSQFTTAICENL